MRKPKALVMPFRFREGYPDELVDKHIASALNLLNEMELEYDTTENILFDDDADLVNNKYNANNYDFVILMIATWIEPVLAIRAVKSYINKPIIVWGFGTFSQNGKRSFLGSMAGAGVVKGTLREMAIRHDFIYHLPGKKETDDEVKARIEKIANVSRAISLLDKAKIISVGYLFGGMSLGDIDISKMRLKFGPELVEIDTYTLVRRMSELNKSDPNYSRALEFVNEHLSEPIGDKVERITKMYMVLKQLVDENKAQAITVKCNFELSKEYGLTACVPLSILGNEVVASCEADIPLTLTQLIMYYLSGGEISTYADIHELFENKALIAACGYAPSEICIGNKVICDLPSETPQGLGATFGDYITNKNYLKSGKVTFGRFLKEKDGDFTLHFTTGTALGDVGEVSELDTPQYPFTEIKIDALLDKFAQNMGSHHYALTYKDISEDLELFCRYMEINVIHD